MKRKKSTDYDARIERYEQQLKEFKKRRRALATKEAREAKKEAKRKETERLIAQGLEADEVFAWMRRTNITRDGKPVTVWDWFEQTRREANREHGASWTQSGSDEANGG